ncbi:MAG: twitching motility protein PilT [Egibacteraceae bacterium]
MAGLTLDAGALIAADRGDRRFWAYWKEAERRDVDVTVPSAVLVQAWRGGRNARMAMLLAACEVEDLDEFLAKQAGVLCGRSETADVVDATLIVSAARRNDDVLTSDPADLAHLAVLSDGVGSILDLTRLPER